jgi:hypothetical protein
MKLALRCRLGHHDWRIVSVNLAGHQSSRSRRCDRCFDHGRLLIQTQARGYYGGNICDPWTTETDKRGEIINGRFVESE